ncbi:hypothetical protein GbCGDNIH5_8167 [Granulibacter bethesdensis]|nr:hypothetical protein GbCGDNIH5_8167 [Granulibacter bethesdensis]
MAGTTCRIMASLHSLCVTLLHPASQDLLIVEPSPHAAFPAPV